MNARTTFPFLALFLLAVTFPLAGCGGGNAENPFALCGNGHLDAGEQCDDGNLIDKDDCLSTCVLASCNDPFGTCNGSDLRGLTCASYSQVDAPGLSCKPNCRLDLSGCGATFTPTPTATATATPTPPAPPPCGDGLLDQGQRCAGGTNCLDTGLLQDDNTTPCCPVAGALNSGEYCTVCAADCVVPTPPLAVTAGPTVVVNFSLPADQTATATTVLIGYRTTLVSLPGSGTAGSVGTRIKNKPANTGLSYSDLDYALRVRMTRGTAFNPGKLFTISFDAIEGTPNPAATDFSCTVEACENGTGDVVAVVAGCTCTVDLPGAAATPTATPTGTATPG